MPSPLVRFRAEGGPGVGMGHLARASALASALRLRGVATEMWAEGIGTDFDVDGIDWRASAPPGLEGPTVVDGYGVATQISDAERPIFSLHQEWDPGAPERVGYLELGGDPAPDALVDLRFACLRRPYWAVAPRPVEEAVRSVLVTSGGSDAASDAGALAAVIANEFPNLRVLAVRGPFSSAHPPPGVELLDRPPHLSGAIAASDLVVTAAGQTMLECLATGTPTIALALAPDQLPQACLAASLGAVELVDLDQLTTTTRLLCEDRDRRLTLAGRAACVDGLGAHRIASALISRFGIERQYLGLGSVTLRSATDADSAFLLRLRNDPEVRAASRSRGEVSEDEHRSWLPAVSEATDRHLLIASINGEEIGQARIDVDPDGSAEISVSLTEDSRGKGLGTAVIRSATLFAMTELDQRAVVACIRAENEGSRLAFERSGYLADSGPCDDGLDRYVATRASARWRD